MNSVTAPGFPVVFWSGWPGEAPVSASNAMVITRPFQLAYTSGCALQVLSDGGAAFDYTVQVTVFPPSLAQYGYTWNDSGTRDDSFASKQWDTLPNGNGTIAAGAPSITTLFAGSTIFQSGRILLKYNSGGSAKILIALASTGG